MHAIVRVNTFDESRLHDAAAEVEAFGRLHAAQPGYAGTLAVDIGTGRRLVVNLWDDEASAAAALRVLGREVHRVLEPIMTAPSQLIGTGAVVDTDLSTGR